MKPSEAVVKECARLGRLPLADARTSWRLRQDRAWTFEGCAFAEALDFNAQLATALREAGIRLWGHHEVAMETKEAPDAQQQP